MVNGSRREFRVGDRVLVPWGVDAIEGEIVEVWGEPVAHVRVSLQVEDDGELEYLLLNPSVITPVAA